MPRDRGPTRLLYGRIESITALDIEGWVWEPKAPSRRIRVELVAGTDRLLVVTADLDRPDLAQLGCGDGRHGFRIKLRDALLTDGTHTLTLRCADSGVLLPGSPVTWKATDQEADASLVPAMLNGARPTFRAHIDQVSERAIVGWIIHPDQPLRRWTVELREAGRVLARTEAAQFRLDLLTAGVGDGCYSFVLNPPDGLRDGLEHLLDVIEVETGFRVANEPIRWCLSATIEYDPFKNLIEPFQPERWALFARVRGHLFDAGKFSVVCSGLRSVLASSNIEQLSQDVREDLIFLYAFGLLASGFPLSETRAILWQHAFWTPRHDGTLECVAALLAGQLDAFAKFSAGAEEELLAGWLDLCDFISAVKRFHNNKALRLLDSVNVQVSRHLTARLRCLLFARTGDYASLKAAFGEVDISCPGLNVQELCLLHMIPELRGGGLFWIVLDQSIAVGDVEFIEFLATMSVAATTVIDQEELEVRLSTAAGNWSAVAGIWARRKRLMEDETAGWINEYKAYFKGGDLQAAMGTALEAQLQPGIADRKDKFGWYWRAAVSALNYSASPPAEPRIVWDLTPLLNIVRSGSQFGGIEKVTANVVRQILIGANEEKWHHTVVYWKENCHRPILLSYDDLERAVFQADRSLLVLSEFCSPEDRYYTPQSSDVVMYLGSHWLYQRYEFATEFYKSAGAKLCVMVYDLLPLQYTDLHPELGRTIFRRWLQFTLPLADVILAISAFSDRAVTQFALDTGIATVKPFVIRLSSEVSWDMTSANPGDDEAWLGANGPGYVLCTSSKSRRKNLLNLIDAWSVLHARLGKECPILLLVGSAGDATEEMAAQLTRADSCGRKIIDLGYVAPGALTQLYRNCLFVVFPSYCEGWGLPVGEALHFGKVVVVLRGTSLEEVGGDLAAYCNSGDASELARVIGMYTTNTGERHNQEVRIADQYKPTTWRQTADDVLRALATVLPALKPVAAPPKRVAAPPKRVAARPKRVAASPKRVAAQFGPKRKVLFLCPSWGKQCGIAQYTQYAAQALIALGCEANVVTSCDELVAKCESGGIDAFFVQHEYGLFDGENQALAGPDSTRDLATAMSRLASSSEGAKGGVIFHSVSLVAPPLAARFKSIAASATNSYILSKAGAEQLGCSYLEHGVAYLPRPTFLRRSEPANGPVLGSFGFLSEHKSPWKLLDVCRRTGAKLMVCFSGASDKARHRLSRDICDLRLDADIRFDFLGEEQLLDFLSPCDLLYFPQQRINYFATTGSVRLAMNVGVPIVVSHGLQFADLGGAVLQANQWEMPDMIRELRKPKNYSRAVASVLSFREENEIGKVYLEEISRLHDGTASRSSEGVTRCGSSGRSSTSCISTNVEAHT